MDDIRVWREFRQDYSDQPGVQFSCSHTSFSSRDSLVSCWTMDEAYANNDEEGGKQEHKFLNLYLKLYMISS